MNVNQLSPAEVSVLAGRISNPRVPPKSKAEAKAHLKLIEQHRRYERQLMEKEAGAQRHKRDNLDFTMKEWEDILPEFEELRWEMRCGNVWRYYALPAPYRGNIWKRVLGNPGGVTEEGYRCWLLKAQDRQTQAAAAAVSAGGGSSSGSSSPSAPMDEAMRRLLDEDPNYFSPRSGKDDSANLIAVDLPRTIITRTGADGHRRVDSSISNQSMSPRGDRPSMDGFSGSEQMGATTSLSPTTNSGKSPALFGNEGCGSDGGGGSPASPKDVSNPSFGSSSFSSTRTALGKEEVKQQHVGKSHVDQGSFANLAFGHQQGQSTNFSTTTLVEAMGQDGGNLMARLETCLRCFVEHRPDMGYVQGMSYLASMLLMNLSDRDAFIALSALLTRGHFPYFYTVNHQGMSAHISVFEQVVRAGAPEVARNLTIIGVIPQMYVCDWWMSLFSRTLPYEITARCWDLYLFDDAYLYRISFCLLVYFSHVIHEDAELDEVMSFISKIQTQPIDEVRFFGLVNDPKLGPSMKDIRGFMGTTLQMLAPQVSHHDEDVMSSNGSRAGSPAGTSSRSLGEGSSGGGGGGGRISSTRSLDTVTTNPEP